jgi:glycosyltransferase involved in cell wall biosynthesis
MRVLLLSWEYPPNVVGGLGKHVAELVPALARRNINVHVVTPRLAGGAERENVEGVVVHRIKVNGQARSDFYDYAQQVNRLLQMACEETLARAGSFDLIHNHDWLTSFAARELKQEHKLPLLATVHATERGRGRGGLGSRQARLINAAEWQLTYEAWRVICCSHYMAGEIRSYFGAPADKLDIIPNGVDPSRFQALESVDLSDFRLRYALPDEKIVMYVGRIVVEKGVEVLIRAAQEVLREAPKTHFIIAGKGPELGRMRDMVDDMGLSERVKLPGFISDEDRDRLLKVADCAAFPSLYEPFGIVALEAMAARAPVVVSEVGGLAEVVRHAETGVTVYPDNVESCAWGILHTLQHPQWAHQRVENAYREVLTVYNWDTIARQTESVYERIVRERERADW